MSTAAWDGIAVMLSGIACSDSPRQPFNTAGLLCVFRLWLAASMFNGHGRITA